MPRSRRSATSSGFGVKWSSMAFFSRLLTITTSSAPEARPSSTTYWMAGRSTTSSISLGWALVAGRKRVPSPAAGMSAFIERLSLRCSRAAHDTTDARWRTLRRLAALQSYSIEQKDIVLVVSSSPIAPTAKRDLAKLWLRSGGCRSFPTQSYEKWGILLKTGICRSRPHCARGRLY